MALAFFAAFGAVIWRLAAIGAAEPDLPRLSSSEAQFNHAVSRPDIVDRNGQMLATDIRVYWLHADPARIVNADDAAEQLAALLPGAGAAALRAKLKSRGRFVWIKRGLTPKEAAAVHNLGLPGLTLTEEPQRVYPAGEAAAHVLGHADIDNFGLAGVEKYIDEEFGLTANGVAAEKRAQVRLALDLRLQYVLRGELDAARSHFGAVAAGGVLLDVRSGDVLALASLPDYDPNRRDNALAKDRRNRMTADTYELGSVFKAFTVALAVDEGLAGPDDRFEIAAPVKVKGFTLRDHHAKAQSATVAEILAHSSNTGAARLGLLAGAARQRAFLQKLGLLSPMPIQIGMTAPPQTPPAWKDDTTVTVSYGHGLSVAPLAFAAAAASLVNGGRKITPRFVLNDAGDAATGPRVLSEEASGAMRVMLRAGVENGTGRRARVANYGVGGKTGTALKPKPGGGYGTKAINSFFAAFPIEDPRYLLFVMLDEPKTFFGGDGSEASQNAAPAAGVILKRILPILGLTPPPAGALSSARRG